MSKSKIYSVIQEGSDRSSSPSDVSPKQSIDGEVDEYIDHKGRISHSSSPHKSQSKSRRTSRNHSSEHVEIEEGIL